MDDFSDINVEEVRKNLEECGIVNGQVVDEKKLDNSLFIKEIKADIQKMEV